MIVVLTAAANADLTSIADHIAADNPERALSFINEISDACRELSHHPERFAIVPRYKAQAVRKRVFGRYLIFYRIGIERIDILHIVHGAADLDAIL